jgi:RNA polymerase sigma factor FliA
VNAEGHQTDLTQAPPQAVIARAQAAYATQSRESVEERMILQHLPLVKHIVRRIADPLQGSVDQDDLISAGTLALVKAARAFDPSRDATFKTYAYIRVRGAVLDELRGRSFVPSTVFAQLRRIEAAHHKLSGGTGIPPADKDLAAEVGISLEKLYRTLQEARKSHFLSIHGLTEDDPVLAPLVPAHEGPSPQDAASNHEMAHRLGQAIRELAQRDRQILLLYYERELTMKEIAKVLGITESRVSQLHAGALFKLSMKLRGK